jgi:diguanylate cyclase (GGDEF)-like protein/putative nucleotidyltransferase with HDIG domain/PAS domain S-box-containing protein
MFRVSPVVRISASIVTICISVILLASVLGILPDERRIESTNRAKLAEAAAVNVSYLVSRYEIKEASKQLEFFASRNPSLMSAGLRRTNGELVIDINDHDMLWSVAYTEQNDGCYVVPIGNNLVEWGQLELQFTPLYAGSSQYFSRALLKLVGLIIAVLGATSWLQLRRILQYLDPTRSVPPRVKQALDNFAEGVAVLDPNERIVLVNSKFADYVSKKPEKLTGSRFWDLPWECTDPSSERSLAALCSGGSDRLQLTDKAGQVRYIFTVKASPVLDDNGKYQGAMLAFNDVTPLERNRAALLDTLEELSRSKKEIAEQNEELRLLATRDPLTSCLNRRTFFEQFESLWQQARGMKQPLCAMMVDIDFFKSINDTHGHSAGDEVLRKVGALLNEAASKSDVVCRYGGEEFALLLPAQDLDAASALGEKIRNALSELKFDGFAITGSLGVSAIHCGASNPQEMLDQADKSLYFAKRNGRNQVARYDHVPENLVIDESAISRVAPSNQPPLTPEIPFAAVSALVTALTFRDQYTGAHSNRVSHYAAMLAQRVLGPKDVYVIEMAGLLHDIGKVGVPDAILLKPGKLTPEEWQIMEKHDKIGIEILRKSFRHDGLTEMVKSHHFKYGEQYLATQGVCGKEIPVGARILTIADSFDAMTSDRPYRKGMAVEAALEELVRCSGTQFDPDLVAEFIELIQARGINFRPSSQIELSEEVLLSIGEQVELLAEAADCGNVKSFIALAERLKQTAQQHGVDEVSAAAAQAIDSVTEDQQLANLISESFELLAACRTARVSLSSVTDNSLREPNIQQN